MQNKKQNKIKNQVVLIHDIKQKMMKKLNLNKVEFQGNLDEIIIQKMKKIKKIKKNKKQSGKKLIDFLDKNDYIDE